ncbi:hypothetical protein MASR2M17_03150 [Aminivibrio sp.]
MPAVFRIPHLPEAIFADGQIGGDEDKLFFLPPAFEDGKTLSKA